jgi:adenine-specific DNA-methyltransferase
MDGIQSTLLPPRTKFPSTRYQGSKGKLADWLWSHLEPLNGKSFLDAFAGTSTVGYGAKVRGMAVHSNDYLRFNHAIAMALVENQTASFTAAEAHTLLRRQPGENYETFIEDTFEEVYFTTAENQQLDVIASNLGRIVDPYKQGLAAFAVGQAAISKRPYNLFHRKNLYMRTANVERSFGNKTTWDRPFSEVIPLFAEEASRAVFKGQQPCRATCADVGEVDADADLVYLDPPYLNAKGAGVDYHGFYHFLEGLLSYEDWSSRIDLKSKHLRLSPRPNLWNNKKTIMQAFEKTVERFADSKIAISYRSDGIPSVAEIEEVLGSHKHLVRTETFGAYKYALSRNRKSQEVLIIGE